jgi:GAF domain-containing protein
MHSSQKMLAAGLRSLLFCPIWWRDELIGTLNFRSTSPERYSDQELQLAARVAQMIAGSIGISSANESLREESRVRQTLAEVSRVIGQGGMSGDAFDQFLNLVRLHVPVDTGFINYVTEETGMLTNLWVGREPLPGTYTNSTMQFDGRLTEQVIQTKLPVTVDMTDENDLENWSDSLSVSIRQGMKSVLAMPLISSSQVVGTLHFRAHQPKAYNQDQLEFLQLITDQIAGEIAMYQLQKQLETRTEERELLANLSRILSTDSPGIETLTPFAERLAQAISFDGIRVNFVDEDAGTITNTFQYGSVPNPHETVVPLQGTYARSSLRHCAGKDLELERAATLADPERIHGCSGSPGGKNR